MTKKKRAGRPKKHPTSQRETRTVGVRIPVSWEDEIRAVLRPQMEDGSPEDVSKFIRVAIRHELTLRSLDKAEAS
jgi:hypothetical protein